MYSSLEKTLPLRLLVLDVDGILTTGHIYFSDQGEIRGFHVHDGFGIQLLLKAGLEVAIISAKNQPSVHQRLTDLGIKYIYLGEANKLNALLAVKNNLSLSTREIAYMGDDLPDLPAMRQSGFIITVPNAPAELQQTADLITRHEGGNGAVREACEWILKAQNRYQDVISPYILIAHENSY